LQCGHTVDRAFPYWIAELAKETHKEVLMPATDAALHDGSTYNLPTCACPVQASSTICLHTVTE
jgi:hypothetical protein